MAFLGGLMSGTSGAFLRGSMDAASNMIQATAQRDEDEIAEKVKTFGAKKTAYDSGVSEYAKETRKINDVASAISGDPSLKDRSPEEIQGLAQQLMTIDSANPVKYFLDNRDKLTITKIETPDVSVQTDEVLATTLEETSPTVEEPASGFKAFAGRLFGGASEDEQIKRAAEQLGITPDMYNRIMASRLPTRSQPNVQVTFGTDDPYQQIIKDNNNAVLSAIKPDQPIYKTEEGASLAKLYLRAYANYGAKKEGAMTAEQLLNLQSDILTRAAPEEAQEFFATYDDILTSANTIIHGDKISKKLRDKALPLYKEVLQMKMKAIDPAYGSDVNNATLYSNKVFELSGMLDISGNSESFKTISAMYERMVNNSVDKPNMYGAENLKMLFALEPAIREAREAGDTELLPPILDALTQIQLSLPETEKSQTDYDKTRENVITFLMSEQGGGLDRTAAELAATQQIDLDKVIMDQQTPSIVVTIDGQKVLKPLPRMSAITGKIGAPGPKIEKLNVEKIGKNNTSIMSIGGAIVGLEKEPDAFNIIGDFYLKGTDIGDMITSPAYMQENYPGFVESAVTIQKMRQDTIPLIATAKDRLFEDPRLSDQDLRLVLDYVAVINDKTIGGTRAMAALINLQAAIAQDQAMRMYQNDPSRKLGTFVNGRLDIEDKNTIAGNIANNLAESQGFTLLSDDEHSRLNSTQKKKYRAQYNRVAAMTNRTIERVQALRDLNGDTEEYRRIYAGQTNLANVGRASLTPDNYDASISIGSLQQELNSGRTRVLNRDPSFYGES